MQKALLSMIFDIDDGYKNFIKIALAPIKKKCDGLLQGLMMGEVVKGAE